MEFVVATAYYPTTILADGPPPLARGGIYAVYSAQDDITNFALLSGINEKETLCQKRAQLNI